MTKSALSVKGLSRREWSGRDSPVHEHTQNPNRFGNVFYMLLSKVLVTQRRLGSYLPMNHVRNADAARSREALQPGRDVDTVAINLCAVDDHVPEVDANAKLHPAVGRPT